MAKYLPQGTGVFFVDYSSSNAVAGLSVSFKDILEAFKGGAVVVLRQHITGNTYRNYCLGLIADSKAEFFHISGGGSAPNTYVVTVNADDTFSGFPR